MFERFPVKLNNLYTSKLVFLGCKSGRELKESTSLLCVITHLVFVSLVCVVSLNKHCLSSFLCYGGRRGYLFSFFRVLSLNSHYLPCLFF